MDLYPKTCDRPHHSNLAIKTFGLALHQGKGLLRKPTSTWEADAKTPAS